MDDLTIDDGTAAGTGADAGAVSAVPQQRLDDLALELGALAAETEGVVRVHARPGAVEIARQALGGLKAAVASVTGRAGAGLGLDVGDGLSTEAGASAAGAVGTAGAAPGRAQPLVTLAVTDDETRVVLDLAVDEAASGPAVARAVAARLLGHLEAQQLPAPTIDVRIVGTES